MFTASEMFPREKFVALRLANGNVRVIYYVNDELIDAIDDQRPYTNDERRMPRKVAGRLIRETWGWRDDVDIAHATVEWRF